MWCFNSMPTVLCIVCSVVPCPPPPFLYHFVYLTVYLSLSIKRNIFSQFSTSSIHTYTYVYENNLERLVLGQCTPALWSSKLECFTTHNMQKMVCKTHHHIRFWVINTDSDSSTSKHFASDVNVCRDDCVRGYTVSQLVWQWKVPSIFKGNACRE